MELQLMLVVILMGHQEQRIVFVFMDLVIQLSN
jgi:hypothetical protein